MAPPRVGVLLVVGQWGVLDQGEEEGGLRVRAEEKGAARAGALCPQRPPEELAEISHAPSLELPSGSSGPVSFQSPSNSAQNPHPQTGVFQIPTLSLRGPHAPGHLDTRLASVRRQLCACRCFQVFKSPALSGGAVTPPQGRGSCLLAPGPHVYPACGGAQGNY